LKLRPTVLSIAGYDPSGGAGILADIKTFEQNKVYGLGVISAMTWQNECEFERVEWMHVEKIICQIEILHRKSKPEFVKIGLVENAETLTQVISYLKNYNSGIKIIWDPVIKASAGFDFHSDTELQKWKDCLEDLFLITPNWNEVNWLSGKTTGLEAAQELSKFCHVYLKGGHDPEKPGYDHLITYHSSLITKNYTFRPKIKDPQPKHGSGCVFAASLTALLAKGYPLKKAGLLAKEYTSRFLQSNKGLLGFHQF